MLPFHWRRRLRMGRLPPPPKVHASPALATMLANSEGKVNGSRRAAIITAGFDAKGGLHAQRSSRIA